MRLFLDFDKTAKKIGLNLTLEKTIVSRSAEMKYLNCRAFSTYLYVFDGKCKRFSAWMFVLIMFNVPAKVFFRPI